MIQRKEFATLVTDYKKWYRNLLVSHARLLSGEFSPMTEMLHKESVVLCERIAWKINDVAVVARIEASIDKALNLGV